MGRTVDRILEQIDLLEYMRACGYTPYPVGSCYGLKEHSSVRIFPESNTYFHPGRGDPRRMNVINFAAWYYGITNGEAIQKLALALNDRPSYAHPADRPLFHSQSKQKPEKKAFQPPEKADHSYRRVYAYLCKKRCLSRAVVDDMVKRHYLIEDSHGNATFLGYDESGKANFCFQRGCGDQPYKHIVAGSDFTSAWNVNNGADKLFVCEAIIDSLSVMSLFQLHGYDPQQYNYVATCGPSIKPILDFLKKCPDIQTIYLGFDNDKAGRSYTERAITALHQTGYAGKIIDKPPKTKDFNEDLQKLSQNPKQISKGSPSQTQNFTIERTISQ